MEPERAMVVKETRQRKARTVGLVIRKVSIHHVQSVRRIIILKGSVGTDLGYNAELANKWVMLRRFARIKENNKLNQVKQRSQHSNQRKACLLLVVIQPTAAQNHG